MLTVEFKLFAVRHPKLCPRLAATHRRIRASLKLDSVDDTRDELKKAALEDALRGVFVETRVRSAPLSETPVNRLLGALFDRPVPE